MRYFIVEWYEKKTLHQTYKKASSMKECRENFSEMNPQAKFIKITDVTHVYKFLP